MEEWIPIVAPLKGDIGERERERYIYIYMLAPPQDLRLECWRGAEKIFLYMNSF